MTDDIETTTPHPPGTWSFVVDEATGEKTALPATERAAYLRELVFRDAEAEARARASGSELIVAPAEVPAPDLPTAEIPQPEPKGARK